jgi:drug/metabolite transporter (DMT)-like permease
MSNAVWTGLAAALSAAVLGSAWQLLSRHGVTTSLGPIEIALMRYGIPALVLLPVLRRVGLRPAGLPWSRLLALVAGGGLPFGLLVLAGAQLAPAAHIGVFMAGTMPVFTALACLILLRESVQPARWIGFAAIAAGVAWLGLTEPALAGAWRGDLLFLAASVAWAVHTVAFRGSGLTALQGAAVVNAWSLIGLLLVVPIIGAPRLHTAPWQDIAAQALGQGVLAGLFGVLAYMKAVERLGSTRASLSAALVPPLTAIGAAAVLGEALGQAVVGASVAVALGIALASGAWRVRLPRGRHNLPSSRV